MKSLLVALSLVVAGATLGMAPLDAEAQRLGRGRPAGMQRQAPPPRPAQPQQTPAQQQATPAQAAAPAAAAAPARRSWLGPIAGLAAGLGIAALLSHLGLGEGFANVLTLLLLLGVAFFVVRWLMRRLAGGQRPAYAGVPEGSVTPGMARRADVPPAAITGGAAPLAPAAMPGVGTPAEVALPPGFDRAGFERIAKTFFIRMQAANDAAQVEDLRRFTTPELFASLRVDLHERGTRGQQTDVVQLDAEIVDAAREPQQQVVTVRFSGLVRESPQAPAEPFDELWHFVQPAGGGDWAVAGIQPIA